jgi:MoxR-like ATPase
MLKIQVEYPDHASEHSIIERSLQGHALEVQPTVAAKELQQLVDESTRIEVTERIREYIVRILEATRTPASYSLKELEPLIELGASPRAGVMLAKAVRSFAYINGRNYVLPEDVKELAPDVLCHRLVLTYEAEAQGVSPEAIVERLLASVGIP